MSWITATLLAGYIGICEYRAPTPWQTCESRWDIVVGVLLPSPIQSAIPAAGRLLGITRRRRTDAMPEDPKP